MIGTWNVSAICFALFNLVGALTWAGIFVRLGFAFGTGIEHVFGHLPVHVHLTAVVAVAVVLLVGSDFGEGSDAAGLSKSFECSEARWAGRAAHQIRRFDQKR